MSGLHIFPSMIKSVASLVEVLWYKYLDSVWTKCALLGSFFQMILIIALQVTVTSLFSVYAAEVSHDERLSGISLYLFLFVLMQPFQFILMADAIYHQNMIEIIAHCMFNVSALGYGIFQPFQLRNVTTAETFLKIWPYSIGILFVLTLFTVIFIYLAFKMYQVFGWKVYKRVGADPFYIKIYREYEVFTMLIKMDFFFFITYSSQFVVLVLHPGDIELALTILAIPISILIIFISIYALRHEKESWMVAFMLCLVFSMAYFIFKLARFYDASQRHKYLHSIKFLTFSAAMCLILIVMTILSSIRCVGYFGKGLPERMAQQKVQNQSRSLTL